MWTDTSAALVLQGHAYIHAPCGVYDTNIDNARIINTVMVLVKMFIMHCKYDRNVLARVAFTKKFMYNVMLLGRLYEKDVFVQLSQMFAET